MVLSVSGMGDLSVISQHQSLMSLRRPVRELWNCARKHITSIIMVWLLSFMQNRREIVTFSVVRWQLYASSRCLWCVIAFARSIQSEVAQKAEQSTYAACLVNLKQHLTQFKEEANKELVEDQKQFTRQAVQVVFEPEKTPREKKKKHDLSEKKKDTKRGRKPPPSSGSEAGVCWKRSTNVK